MSPMKEFVNNKFLLDEIVKKYKKVSKNNPLAPFNKFSGVGFFINPNKIRAFKLQRSVIFIEKQHTKYLAPIGAI